MNTTMTRLQPLTPKASTSAQVLSALRDALLSGAYEPGERLHETRIATELGVSKTPVREALARLRSSGLVQRSGSRGLTVTSVDTDTIRNLYELRALTEPAGVFRSVPRMNREVLADARQLLESSARSAHERNLPDLSKINRQFHELICAQCGNPYVLAALENLRDMLQFVAARGWLAHSSWDLEGEEHLQILAAAEAGDARLAARLTREHIEHAAARLTDGRVLLTDSLDYSVLSVR